MSTGWTFFSKEGFDAAGAWAKPPTANRINRTDGLNKVGTGAEIATHFSYLRKLLAISGPVPNLFSSILSAPSPSYCLPFAAGAAPLAGLAARAATSFAALVSTPDFPRNP